jgi:hypothetical protein
MWLGARAVAVGRATAVAVPLAEATASSRTSSSSVSVRKNLSQDPRLFAGGCQALTGTQTHRFSLAMRATLLLVVRTSVGFSPPPGAAYEMGTDASSARSNFKATFSRANDQRR